MNSASGFIHHMEIWNGIAQILEEMKRSMTDLDAGETENSRRP
jgi:hypothetical protein